MTATEDRRCLCYSSKDGTRTTIPAYCPTHGDPGGVTVIWTAITDASGRVRFESDLRIEERWQP